MIPRDKRRERLRRVLALWISGHDTTEIAMLLEITQAQAANLLAAARDMPQVDQRRTA